MHFVEHPQHTNSLGAPAGWDHSKVHCGSLSVNASLMHGMTVLKSRWEMSREEALLLALQAEQIELAVFGANHPPVSMATMPKVGWTADRDAMLESYNRVLRTLAEHAQANGFKLGEAIPGCLAFVEVQHLPTVVGRLTWDQFVAAGRASGCELNGPKKMPWSFTIWNTVSVTHENDELYLLAGPGLTPDPVMGSTTFKPGDMLCGMSDGTNRVERPTT